MKTLTGPQHAEYLAVRDLLRDVLHRAQEARTQAPASDPLHREVEITGPTGSTSTEPAWVVATWEAMHAEVNRIRALAGLAPVDIFAIRRVESSAMGHIDYSEKFALRCADLVVDDDYPFGVVAVEKGRRGTRPVRTALGVLSVAALLALSACTGEAEPENRDEAEAEVIVDAEAIGAQVEETMRTEDGYRTGFKSFERAVRAADVPANMSVVGATLRPDQVTFCLANSATGAWAFYDTEQDGVLYSSAVGDPCPL